MAEVGKQLSFILYSSPFFTELTVREREDLVQELLRTYPQLSRKNHSDEEVGYEASWLNRQYRN
jgi:hypothetical protein